MPWTSKNILLAVVSSTKRFYEEGIFVIIMTDTCIDWCQYVYNKMFTYTHGLHGQYVHTVSHEQFFSTV